MLMFYFTYRIMNGTTNIEHQIECDLNAPLTLVINGDNRGMYVSIIVGADDKREWFVTEIVRLAFGFSK